VLGVEGGATLVAQAKDNAASLGLSKKARFSQANLFEVAVGDLRRYGTADKWLLDPPRDGAFALIKALVEAHEDTASVPAFKLPTRIVYVSCDPSTLARDAGLLVHKADYKCVAAGVVNMFPHTAHVESIAVFERSDESRG
jgi:23S rRNA (uracil1939-C5)-methyltransferase